MAVDERDDLSVRLEQLIESSAPPVTFEEIRARAGAPRRRRRVPVIVGVAALVLALALTAGVFLSMGGDNVTVGTADQDVLDGESESDTSETTSLDYGLPPLTPLVDEPLPMVPQTELAVLNDHVFTAEVSAFGLTLALTGPIGSGSHGGDPQAMPAVTYSMQGPSSQDPEPRDYFVGASRAEVARLELVTGSDSFSVETFAHDAFPQLRFFLLDAPPGTWVGGPDALRRPPRVNFTAYAADGTVLTDSERISAEFSEFAREVDRRKGVEEKPAAIIDATVGSDDQHIVLTVTNCGSEVSPEWAIDDDTLTITATVKRPYAEGPCLTGDTTEIGIGLEAPLAGRTLIDGWTGASIPTAP